MKNKQEEKENQQNSGLSFSFNHAEEEFKWYVVACTSSKESKIKLLLHQKIRANNMENIITDIVIPMQEKIIIKQGKKQTVQERILPGYILIKMIPTEEAINLIKNTEGITSFVSNFSKSKIPTPLNDKEAKSILAFTQIKQDPIFSAKFSVGDAVKVIEGPFKDFIGNVKEINESKGQVTVLLSIFDRETPVQLDILQVNKI